MMEITNSTPWMSGITRDEEYSVMLKNQKGLEYNKNGTPVSEIIERLLPKGGRSLYFNDQIRMDLDIDDLDSHGDEVYLRYVVSGDAPPDHIVHVWMMANDGHQTEIIVEVVPE